MSRARPRGQGTGLGGDDDDDGGDGGAGGDSAAGGRAAPLALPAPPPASLQLDFLGGAGAAPTARTPTPAAAPDLLGGLEDLMSGLGAPPQQQQQQQQQQQAQPQARAMASNGAPPPPSGASLLDDLLGLGGGGGAPAQPAPSQEPAPPAMPVLLPAASASGLEVSGALVRSQASRGPALRLRFRNGGQTVLDGFLLQLNKNVLCLAPASPLTVRLLPPGGTATVEVLLSHSGAPPPPGAPPHPLPTLQVALKSPNSPPPGVFYFSLPLAAEACFAAGAPGDAATLASAWRTLGEPAVSTAPSARMFASLEAAQGALAQHGVVVAHARPLPDGSLTLYAGALLPPSHPVVIELAGTPGGYGVRVAAKAVAHDAAALAADAVARLIA